MSVPVAYSTAMPFLSMRMAQTQSGLDAALLPMPETVSRHFSAMALSYNFV